MPARPGPAKGNDEIGAVLPQEHGIRLDAHDFGAVHDLAVLIRFAIDDRHSPRTRNQHGGERETGRSGHATDASNAATEGLHRIAWRRHILRARSGSEEQQRSGECGGLRHRSTLRRGSES